MPFVIVKVVMVTVSVNIWLPLRPEESVAVIVAAKVPACVGMPTIVPLELSIVKPGGKPVPDQV